jgi:ABC-type nitrate/sulfonate/bicarbonate transport system substrate-binding protein
MKPLVALAMVAVLAACTTAASPTPTATQAAATPTAAGASATPAGFVAPDLTGQKMKLLFASGANLGKIQIIHALHILQAWGADTSYDFVDSQQIGIGAVISGSADVVDSGPSDAIDAVQAGGNVELFALSAPRYDYIFTCKPSITQLSQLKGVTIGVVDTTGTNLQQSIIVMQAAGLSINDATLVVTGGQTKRVAALLAGRTDCTIVGYYNYLTVKAQGYTAIFNFMSQGPALYYTASFTTKDWLASHQAMALAYNEALLLSFRWLDDPANRAQYVNEALHDVDGTEALQVGEAYDVYLKNNFTPPNAILTDADLTSQMNQLVAMGAYKTAIPTSQYADLTFGQQALAAVGTAP